MVTIVFGIIFIGLLLAIYTIAEMYKNYNLEKQNFIPLAIQIFIVLLIPAIIINIAWILFLY